MKRDLHPGHLVEGEPARGRSSSATGRKTVRNSQGNKIKWEYFQEDVIWWLVSIFRSLLVRTLFLHPDEFLLCVSILKMDSGIKIMGNYFGLNKWISISRHPSLATILNNHLTAHFSRSWQRKLLRTCDPQAGKLRFLVKFINSAQISHRQESPYKVFFPLKFFQEGTIHFPYLPIPNPNIYLLI